MFMLREELSPSRQHTGADETTLGGYNVVHAAMRPSLPFHNVSLCGALMQNDVTKFAESTPAPLSCPTWRGKYDVGILLGVMLRT